MGALASHHAGPRASGAQPMGPSPLSPLPLARGQRLWNWTHFQTGRGAHAWHLTLCSLHPLGLGARAEGPGNRHGPSLHEADLEPQPRPRNRKPEADASKHGRFRDQRSAA